MNTHPVPARALPWVVVGIVLVALTLRAPKIAPTPVITDIRTGLRLSAATVPFVLLYSDDLEETQRAIVRAGGSIVQAPYAFPGGRRLHFADPSGNELGVWAE